MNRFLFYTILTAVMAATLAMAACNRQDKPIEPLAKTYAAYYEAVPRNGATLKDTSVIRQFNEKAGEAAAMACGKSIPVETRGFGEADFGRAVIDHIVLSESAVIIFVITPPANPGRQMSVSWLDGSGNTLMETAAKQDGDGRIELRLPLSRSVNGRQVTLAQVRALANLVSVRLTAR